MKTLKNLFLDELADIYDAEKRIAKALPKLASATTCEELRSTLLAHSKETEAHVKQVEEVFACFDQKARGKTCEATIGLLEEGEDVAEEYAGSPAINAALIAAAQKVEHYEMASYGCLHEWAELMENGKAAQILQGILDEEKAANEALNERAHATSNEEALGKSDNGGTSASLPGASVPPGRRTGRVGRSNRPGAKRLA